ncbi:immunity 21 family protein [Streptomyces sp. 15-116A]|uniref:immunity 21 family protein n=1 Tax=Streptomyces sp. 15-116A TaxID=2259035 RepID=UPI0021B1C0A7|nr:immunity 21 family protein [Streptomyces sp. 15-116A]MCT7351836.1 immunity 21 family protein [Streptomyces sp. 15-116A]
MTTETAWIDSLGGLYVCLPESIRELWQGGVEDDEDDSEEATDYWRAGQTDRIVGTYSVAGVQALVLAAGEGPLTYVPSLDLFVQRRAKTSVTDVINAVIDAFPALHWETITHWEAGSDLVVFDAVWSGREVPPKRLLRVPRPAGPVNVQVAEVSPRECWNIWVTLYRLV